MRIQDVLFHPLDIVHCTVCDFDLRETLYKTPSSAEYEMNAVHFIINVNSYGKAGQVEFQYSNLYFEGIKR